MTQLKTLKDMMGNAQSPYPKDWCLRKELKQEAIKWIKGDIEDYRTAKIFENNKPIDWRKVHNFIVQQRQKWKDRFNITSEEL